MAHQAIYRKWRPMVFEDIVGQQHITKTLKNQITSGKIGHAYLSAELAERAKPRVPRCLRAP